MQARYTKIRKPEVYRLLLIVGIVLFVSAVRPAFAAEDAFSGIELRIGSGGDQEGMSTPVRILLLLTLLSFIPAILISVTSFTRLIIVTHFLRQALGTQTMPPNQVLIGLWILAILSNFTAVQRIYVVWRASNQEEVA